MFSKKINIAILVLSPLLGFLSWQQYKRALGYETTLFPSLPPDAFLVATNVFQALFVSAFLIHFLPAKLIMKWYRFLLITTPFWILTAYANTYSGSYLPQPSQQLMFQFLIALVTVIYLIKILINGYVQKKQE